MPLNEVEFRSEFKAAISFICIEKVAVICYNTVSKVLFFSDAKGGNQTVTELGHFRMCIETYFRNSRGFRVLSVCRSIRIGFTNHKQQ